MKLLKPIDNFSKLVESNLQHFHNIKEFCMSNIRFANIISQTLGKQVIKSHPFSKLSKTFQLGESPLKIYAVSLLGEVFDKPTYLTSQEFDVFCFIKDDEFIGWFSSRDLYKNSVELSASKNTFFNEKLSYKINTLKLKTPNEFKSYLRL